jgi:hypothetical protein
MRLAGHVGCWDGLFPNVPNRGTLGGRDRAVFLSQRGPDQDHITAIPSVWDIGTAFLERQELYKGRFSRPARAKAPNPGRFAERAHAIRMKDTYP